jgi:hypothetical protein
MGFEDSPSISEYAHGLSANLSDPNRNKRRAWIVIAILSFIVLFLSVIAFLQSNSFAISGGTGTLTGRVISERNQPIEAEIIILGTEIKETTNKDGNFIILGVPSGNRSVAILYRESGWEYPITIYPGQVMDMGEIKFIPTTEPVNQ